MIDVIEVNDIEGKERIDVYLSEKLEKTRSHFAHLIEKGCVKIGNNVVKKSGEKIKNGDVITIDNPELVETIEKKDIPLDVIYQDKDIAIINKQQGLTVHPSAGNYDNTLVNALMFHLDSLSGINGEVRPGIVHRLDKDTSGIMVVAKNDDAHANVSAQIENRKVKKVYLAVVEGVLKIDSGEIITNIGRSNKDRKQMAVTLDGKQAITRYKVLQRYKNNTLVAFHIITGRTHQIRVHAKYMKHPVVGDELYGYKKQRFSLDGQLLHAYSLTFDHPTTKERISFSAPVPAYFNNVCDILSKESGVKLISEDDIAQLVADID